MGKKKVLKISQVRFIAVRRIEELSVKRMVNLVKDDASIAEYMPDEFFENKTPYRDFIFNIINSIYPDYLQQLISHA